MLLEEFYYLSIRGGNEISNFYAEEVFILRKEIFGAFSVLRKMVPDQVFVLQRKRPDISILNFSGLRTLKSVTPTLTLAF